MTAPEFDTNGADANDAPITRNPRRAAITRGRTDGAAIRVLVVDDHSLLRQALTALLSTQSAIEVVGEAENGREAVEAAEDLLPDVVLMDGVMPGLNGIDATRQITKRLSGTRVIMLTAYLEDERVLEALRAGASGYMMKNADADELVLGIQSVHRGNTFFSTTVAEELAIDEVLMQARAADGRTGYDLLTGREREVLQLIAEGLSNVGIAEELVISVKTVEAHRAHIMTKLNAKNRTDLIRYAIRRGLVAVDGPTS